ncbi:MAG: hypothetical protein EX271_02190 [Acidimicrobiales bacterium]|nr:hypothetical protein [Hyphomonadaceae bacterium]RZV44260.1 MAG: hypothetical protein EX271_02190 [Acidimicrobiales bacterium]
MSRTSILKSGLIASACVAGLTLSACASSNTHNSSRYGVSDYESGGDCTVSPCGPSVSAPAPDSRYGSVTAEPVQAPPPPPPAVYQQPAAPVYVQQAPTTSYSTSQFVGETADCPPGTSRSGDGTCMMSSDTTAFSSGSAYSAPAASYSTSYMSTGETADCPPGTSRSNDGTCLMSSGGSLGSDSSTSAYAGSSATLYSGSTDTTQFADCPAGSTRSASGSCTVSSGYVPSTTYTPPATYLPIRK